MSFNWRLSRCSVAAVAAVAAVALVELPAWGGPGTGTTFCPPEAQQATEQCGVDVNGGCGAGMQFIHVSCGDVWCGNGWTDSGTRDVDWYLVPLLDPDGDGVGKLTATVVSDFPAVCFLIDGVGPGECNPVVVATGCGDGGLNIEVASATLQAPGSYGVFVAAGDCSGNGIFSGFPCGTRNSYFVSVQCASPCPADFDRDGFVGITDFLVLLAQWGTDPGGPPDFDGDGNVGIVDFLELLANWGPCP